MWGNDKGTIIENQAATLWLHLCVLKASAPLWYSPRHCACHWQSIASLLTVFIHLVSHLFPASIRFFFFFLPFLFIVSPNDGWLISPLSTLPACLPACLLWVGAIKVPSLIMPSSSSNVFLLGKMNWIKKMKYGSYSESQRHRTRHFTCVFICICDLYLEQFCWVV